MKYWLFQNNQVTGPLPREELTGIAGFSAESLVCPEGRRGTAMGDWQRAGVVAELADSLLRMARVPAGAGMDDSPGSLLPPEPTLRDLALLGTLQEKVELLENALTHFNDELRQRDDEIAALKTSLDLKGQESGELRAKLGDLESKLGEAFGAREQVQADLSKAREEEARQAQALEELKGRVDAMGSELQNSIGKFESEQTLLRDEFKSDESRLKDELSQEMSKKLEETASRIPAPAPAPRSISALELGTPAAPGLDAPVMPVPSMEPDPALPPVEELPEAAPPIEAAPALGPAPSLEAPAEVPMGLPQELPSHVEPPAALMGPPPASPDLPAPDFGASPGMTPSGMDSLALTPPSSMGVEGLPSPFGDSGVGLSDMSPMELPAATPIPLGTTDVPPPEGLVDLTSSVPGASPAVGSISGAKKPRGKKGLLMALIVLVALGGGVGGAYMGFYKIPGLSPFLDSLKKGKAPEPAQPEKPADGSADPSAGLPDRAQEAVESAKNYVIPRTGKALALTLEGPSPAPGLSPWNVSPLDKDRYQVQFYAKGGGEGKTADYQFEVQLEAGIIRGMNAKSQAVLNGEPPAGSAAEAPPRPEPKARKPRPRKAKPAAENPDLLADPLGAMLMESEGKPEVRPPAGETEGEEAEGEEAVEPKPKARGRRSKPKPQKTQEELTLDELLLPGVPKQR